MEGTAVADKHSDFSGGITVASVTCQTNLGQRKCPCGVLSPSQDFQGYFPSSTSETPLRYRLQLLNLPSHSVWLSDICIMVVVVCCSYRRV